LPGRVRKHKKRGSGGLPVHRVGQLKGLQVPPSALSGRFKMGIPFHRERPM
jgi:hypothetical protein